MRGVNRTIEEAANVPILSAWDKTIEILRLQPSYQMDMPHLVREMGTQQAQIFGMERDDLLYAMRREGVLRIDDDAIVVLSEKYQRRPS